MDGPLVRAWKFTRFFAARLASPYYPWRIATAIRDRRRLREVRRDRKPDGPEPLVSIVIPTYNRGELLVTRAVASALRQTYRNVEVIVVGDHCTDDTEARMAAVKDPRVRFLNLPERGKYPSDPFLRWMVAGVVPANKGVEMARGAWIAPLDDDDTFTDDHVEVLLDAARREGAEMAYCAIEGERPDGTVQRIGSWPPRRGKLTRIGIFYRKDLGFENDLESWRWKEPADWELVRRMYDSGVRMAFVDRVLGKHYAERQRMGL